MAQPKCLHVNSPDIFSRPGSNLLTSTAPILEKKPENWQYLHFDTEHSGIEFRRTSPDTDTYELVIVRKKELDLVQAIFCTFPDFDEYKTKDLFTPHPTESGHWLYASRLDDIIVFSNGEKLNPVTMEGVITSGCPEVQGCLVVGQGKFQSALLVEAKDPPQSDRDREEMISKIWPVVQRANQSCVGHGRIAKDFILFTEPEKPLPRAGKGTIQRQRAVDLYKQRIDDFYSGQTTSSNEADSKVNLENLATTQETLQKYIAEELDLDEISIDDDLFRYGVDSLQVMGLVRAINQVIGNEDEQIDAKQVYENPTIRKLAQALQSDEEPRMEDDDDIESWVEMQQTFHDLASTLQASTYRPVSLPSPPRLELNHLRQDASPHSSNSETTVVNQTSSHRDVEKAASYQTERDSYDASKDTDFLISMIPPDGGIVAWKQVLASFLINFNTFGLINAFGDYQAFYETQYLASYSSSDVSWIGTIQAALLLIIGVVSGPIFDKGYFTLTLRIASITLVFAWMMLSLANKYYEVRGSPQH